MTRGAVGRVISSFRDENSCARGALAKRMRARGHDDTVRWGLCVCLRLQLLADDVLHHLRELSETKRNISTDVERGEEPSRDFVGGPKCTVVDAHQIAHLPSSAQVSDKASEYSQRLATVLRRQSLLTE